MLLTIRIKATDSLSVENCSSQSKFISKCSVRKTIVCQKQHAVEYHGSLVLFETEL